MCVNSKITTMNFNLYDTIDISRGIEQFCYFPVDSYTGYIENKNKLLDMIQSTTESSNIIDAEIESIDCSVSGYCGTLDEPASHYTAYDIMLKEG